MVWGRHMTQVWPISFLRHPGHRDWLRNVHVTQVRPMRLNSGILVRFVRENRLLRFLGWGYMPGTAGAILSHTGAILSLCGKHLPEKGAALVCWACHNKASSQARWLKQQEFIIPRFWRLVAKCQQGEFLFRPLSLARRWPSSFSVFTGLPSVSVF